MLNVQRPSIFETTHPSFPTATGTTDTILTETEIRETAETTQPTATMIPWDPYLKYLLTDPGPPAGRRY